MALNPSISLMLKHKAKHTDRCFKIYLMRLPMNEKSSPPKWDKHTLLEGVGFCLAHPLYNAESLGWLKSWKNYPHPKPRLRKKVKSTLVHFLLMLIGLISDTHDHLKMIEKAVAFFNESNVGMVLHAGDVISPFTARKFKECRSRLILVYGNNDGDRSNLQRAFSEIGAQFYWPAAMLELEGRRILVLHGEDTRLVDEIAGKNMFDLILSGHTHEADVKRIKGTLWVNPGEACGYLTGRSTVGLYDSSKHEAEIIEI